MTRICDPPSAGDRMREQSHAHFTVAEQAEPGSSIGFIAGDERWNRAPGAGHGEALAKTVAASAPRQQRSCVTRTPGRRVSDA